MSVSPSQSAAAGSPFRSNITRGYSCVLCQQRKVKCDRQKPCSNCVKSRAECVSSTPAAPRRRKRKSIDIDLRTKVERYEQLLKAHGVNPGNEEIIKDQNEVVDLNLGKGLSLDAPRSPNSSETKGKLLTSHGKTHYVENTLWENLRDEVQDEGNILHESSEDETPDSVVYPEPGTFLVGYGTATEDTKLLHPQPAQIFRLWHIFLVNVNPMVKTFHAPTVQQNILDASGDLKNVSKPIEALMFAIYLLAVTSLGDEECANMFGDSRRSLLSKYSHGTQKALINAKFLKSWDIIVLQAYSLYLLAVRNAYDPHSFWVLTGCAVRIAQKLGLHRDGSIHKLSPFEVEMRRRSWWQIAFLDILSAKAAGAQYPDWLGKADTKPPLNISDSDLNPAMKQPPIEREGATEMLICCMRCEVAEGLRRCRAIEKSGDEQWQIAEQISKKDKAIDQLEALLERKYTRFCDPSIPLHLLAIYISKSVITNLRLMAHHPGQYSDKGASLPQEEKDKLFADSMRILEYYSLGHSVKSVRGFMWHTQVNFQIGAFVYTLSELRDRTTGDMVDRAWHLIEQAYKYHPKMFTDTKNRLYFALGNLTVKAWQKREEARGLHNGGRYQNAPPQFISELCSQRGSSIQPQLTNENQDKHNKYQKHDAYSSAVDDVHYNSMEHSANNEFSLGSNMPDITTLDWEYWQTLLEGDLSAYNGDIPDNFYG